MVHSRVEINTRPSPRLVTCRFWKEVQWLEDHPRHATSLLLMTNPYWASNFDAFEQFGDALTQALQSATESKVEGLGFEGQIQLVFFHPQYVFRAVQKSKFYGAFVLNLRVDFHAIDASPARWRGDAGSSPLDGASTATSSPRNDLVKNYRAPDTLVDFHTGRAAGRGQLCGGPPYGFRRFQGFAFTLSLIHI